MTRSVFSFLLSAALLATAIILTAPFYVRMPETGLDPSWMFAINEAVSSKLSFGRDIIFTYGPYGALYFRVFHPSLDFMLMVSGLFLGSCFGVVLLLLARTNFWWGLGVLYVVAGQMFARDVLFASYGFFLIVLIGAVALEKKKALQRFSSFEVILFTILIAALGLLPLIKASLVINVAASMLAAILLFAVVGDFRLAALAGLAPVSLMLCFWSFSGQSLADLPIYFRRMIPIVSGYTEAMSSPGDYREIVVYACSSGALLYSVWRSSQPWEFKAPMLIAVSIFLFSAFKGGFVRHDSHAFFAAASILTAAVALNVSAFRSGATAAATALSIVAWFVINTAYIHSPYELFVRNFEITYQDAASGLDKRFRRGSLEAEFSARVVKIASEGSLPRLEGTSDIYNFGQSFLLASGNKWSPRPVLQSYSAYTPTIAELDRVHLGGPGAPDNIFFKLETIDGRYPSMDDGASWPAILANYIPSEKAAEYLVLKRDKTFASPNLQQISTVAGEFGNGIGVPGAGLIYARLDVSPTVLGRLAGLVYKVPPLSVLIKLQTGELKKFRIVSGMARAGFFLSPLVETTEEFGQLFGDLRALEGKPVLSLLVDGDPTYWQRNFQIAFASMQVNKSHPPISISRNSAAEQIGSGPELPVSEVDACEGSIDRVNGRSGSSSVSFSGAIEADGWTTVSGKDATVPASIYLTLETKENRRLFFKTKLADRPDLKAFFKQPTLENAGFRAAIDASNIEGDSVLGVAREVNGRMELCKNLRVSLRRESAVKP